MTEQIYIFGDSLAKGVVFDQVRQRYALLKESFVNLWCSHLGAAHKNYSKFGCTIDKGAQTVQVHRQELADADCVLLEFGGNDSDFDWGEVAAHPEAAHEPKTPLPEFSRQYSRLIEEVRGNAGNPVLLNLPPIDPQRYFAWISRDLDASAILRWLGGSEFYIYRWHEMYSVEIGKIAQMHSVPMIDIRSAFLARRDYASLLCEDGIHPNEAGHRLISETIAAAVEGGHF